MVSQWIKPHILISLTLPLLLTLSLSLSLSLSNNHNVLQLYQSTAFIIIFLCDHLYCHQMIAQNTMRTRGMKLFNWPLQGIYLYQQQSLVQSDFFLRTERFSLHTWAFCSELPSHTSITKLSTYFPWFYYRGCTPANQLHCKKHCAKPRKYLQSK